MGKESTSAQKKEAPVEEVLEETVVTEEPVEETVTTEETATVEEPVEETAKVVEKENPPHVVEPLKTSTKKKKLGNAQGTIVKCNALRLREGANIRTRELAQIPSGTHVLVNLDNSTDSFYEVTFNNGTHDLIGYCLKDYISIG